MSSLNEKLDYLNETKQLIRSSLVQKGQTVDDSTPFRDYASKILNIDTQSDFIDNRTVINDFTYQNDGYYKDIPNPDNYKVNTTVLCIGNLYSAENVLEQTAFVIYQIMSISDGNAHCKVVDILDEYNVGDIKLFETEEEMQADSSAKEGDLAVVYKSEIQNMTADMEVTSLTFPETVTLPTAFTGRAKCSLRAVDSGTYFNGNCILSQTSFSFDGRSESGMIRVNYTSTDGITYTRTRFQGGSGDLTNPVEIPACKVYNPEEWNDNLGYFMQIGGMNFNGLYKYGKYTVDGYISIPLINDDYTITSTPSKGVTINNSYSNSFNKQDLIDICKEIEASVSSDSANSVSLFMKNNKLYALGYVRSYNGNIYLNSLHNEIGEDNTILSNVLVDGRGTSSGTEGEPNFEVKIWEIDMSNKSYSLNTSIQYEISYIKSISSSGTIFYSTRVTFAEPFDTMCFSQIYSRIDFPYMWKHVSGGDFDQYHITCDLTYHKSEYQIAPNQYTLTKSNQLLENISAYGKDGNIVGSMKDNGELNYTPSDEEQTIPAGYTSGGSVAPISSSAIPNLVPENIVYGKQILDVVGITPDGSDFELVTKTNIEAIQSTTSPGKSYSNHPYFTNTIIVDSNGVPLGGFMAKGTTVYTFGWNGTDIVNKKTYSTSSLGISSINEDAIYSSNPDKNMSGIVGFICGSSHYVYFLTYEVKYTIENGIMCPSIEISNKKGKWRIYDASVITTNVNFLAFNPWDKTSCVCHGANKKDVFIKLNEPTTFDSYTDCTTVQYTRSSNAMLNLNSKGHFAKNGEVFYVREKTNGSQADVYYLTNNGLPAKKNSLGLILISGDGNYGINYNGNKVTLSYSDNGTVSITTGERIEGFDVYYTNRYGIGTITNKVYIAHNGEWTSVDFYNIDWDNNIATKFGSFTPVKGKDLGYLDQNSLEDCGSNALFGACTNPNNYDYTAYPRMIFVGRNLGEITAIKYKGELYYPNTIDSIEYQQALDTAIEIKGGNV